MSLYDSNKYNGAMFPYKCVECGGATSRCAYGCCDGGQLCWEENCRIIALEQVHTPDGALPIRVTSIPILEVKYNGYGRFITDNPAYATYEFVTEDVSSKEYDKKKHVFHVEAMCASCYDPDLCKLCKDDRCERH